MTWTSIKTQILQSLGGDLPCVSNPCNLSCIPKSLNLPFSFIGSRQDNTSYTMEKQLGRNLTLPGAQLLMDLHGHHTSPYSSHQPSLFLSFSTIEIFVGFSSLTLKKKSSWIFFVHFQQETFPHPTRFLRTFRNPSTHGSKW